MCGCYVSEEWGSAEHSDHGFMGTTHALSGVAAFMALTYFFPDQVFSLVGASTIPALLVFVANIVGGSLSVDLDNTASTSKSSLGILGDVMSEVYRTISVMVQSVMRTRKDNKEPNPHRGFFHTVPAALLVGAIVCLLTATNFFHFSVPYLGNVSSGKLFAFVFTWLNLHMALAGLARSAIKSIRRKAKQLGDLVAFAISFVLTLALFSSLGNFDHFAVVGIGTAIGMIVHTLGDCFTTAGSPILFPIPFHGKMWWTVRFLKIHAGGTIEKMIFVPFFAVSSVIFFLLIARMI